MPFLVQAGAVMGQRSFNVFSKMFMSQLDYARELLPGADLGGEAGEADADPFLYRVDSTRAHLRRIADIVSHESRALISDMATIADAARALAENSEDSRIYRRRWKAKF